MRTTNRKYQIDGSMFDYLDRRRRFTIHRRHDCRLEVVVAPDAREQGEALAAGRQPIAADAPGRAAAGPAMPRVYTYP